MGHVSVNRLGSLTKDDSGSEIFKTIEDVVGYHKPDEEGLQAITNIRQATSDMIRSIILNCPQSADRTAAIRKVREAMMTANASIVIGSAPLET